MFYYDIHRPNHVEISILTLDFWASQKHKISFKFDEDGNGTIEFAEFLVMMATKAKEAEIEEAENFIPCCFRVMRDKKGKTLKVQIPIYSTRLAFNNVKPKDWYFVLD